jgi:hypothetical protein
MEEEMKDEISFKKVGANSLKSKGMKSCKNRIINLQNDTVDLNQDDKIDVDDECECEVLASFAVKSLSTSISST